MCETPFATQRLVRLELMHTPDDVTIILKVGTVDLKLGINLVRLPHRFGH